MKRRRLSAAVVALAVFVFISLVSGLLVSRHLREEHIRHNLRMLQSALREYMDARKGLPPASIDDMLTDFQIPADHILLTYYTREPEVSRYHMLNVTQATTRPDDGDCPVFTYDAAGGFYSVTFFGTVRWNKF